MRGSYDEDDRFTLVRPHAALGGRLITWVISSLSSFVTKNLCVASAADICPAASSASAVT
ncbi:hypothetical protein BDV96DRAFT_577965 [Lophiotrema nucula]|uniref:Uncharacterized protein n=1 Tax=Lophiotrema nucula TaxID=690887 RepID=A0A6A5Z5D8_9PLEO|nr:hypothetical protein BDV96DRAFT_577965 [Lophiotrema nucula]